VSLIGGSGCHGRRTTAETATAIATATATNSGTNWYAARARPQLAPIPSAAHPTRVATVDRFMNGIPDSDTPIGSTSSGRGASARATASGPLYCLGFVK
jgi:hypothetical protein